ncbi:unnamed protein product [Heligmosomoides polygyrus]|uniref:G_PROTEIN_RECEP_F1_2 domain-containing protein n=1 Tax=Heligmosomoides polygyrus TaxID=6339 RepID=A0A183FIP8_HELPZ|nr:unnamed protein product [Heligmosomoides polygyrus]
MSGVDIVSVVFHTTTDSFGMLFNLVLLYLVIYRTPSNFEVYAILIGNFAITDFSACLASFLIQQRIIPAGTSLVYFSHGPCKFVGEEFCYIIYDFMLSCYTHSLYCLLFSFYFRYYVLANRQPTATSLRLLIVVIAIPSTFQFIILSFANQPAEELIPILGRELPQYNLTGETISGHTNVFEWKLFTAILHMTLPITPVYIGILVLRRRIILMLSTDTMSENTKKVHKQLLKALTYQALLPCFFSMGVASYTIGQLGICQSPYLETFTFFSFGVLPVVSPLLSLYFIRPYRRIVLACLCGTLNKTSPSTETYSKSGTVISNTRVPYSIPE